MHTRTSFGFVTVIAVSALAIGGCSTPESPREPGSSSPSASSPSSASAASMVAVAPGCISGVDAAEAQAIVRKEHVGGVFVGSWTDKSILTSGAAKKLSTGTVPVMVSVDQEGGRVSRLKAIGIDSPSPRELAKTKTPEQVRQLALGIGKQLRALGVTVDFAPVIDVSDQGADTVIGDRSFSSNPVTVTKYGRAFAAGLRDAARPAAARSREGVAGLQGQGAAGHGPAAECLRGRVARYRQLGHLEFDLLAGGRIADHDGVARLGQDTAVALGEDDREGERAAAHPFRQASAAQ